MLSNRPFFSQGIICNAAVGGLPYYGSMTANAVGSFSFIIADPGEYFFECGGLKHF